MPWAGGARLLLLEIDALLLLGGRFLLGFAKGVLGWEGCSKDDRQDSVVMEVGFQDMWAFVCLIPCGLDGVLT